MFYRYDENLRLEYSNKKMGFTLFDGATLVFFSLFAFVTYREHGFGQEMLECGAFAILFVVGGRMIEGANRALARNSEQSYKNKLEHKMKEVKEKYDILGVTLDYDNMHITGFCEVQVDGRGHDHFVEKYIFYKDIVNLWKTETTTWVYYMDRDTNKKVGLLINKYFENSDDLFKELKKRTNLK